MSRYPWRRKANLKLMALVILVSLSACGGGGGGGGSTAASPAVIDSGNAATIARAVISVGLDTGAFGGAVGGGGVLAGDGGSNALAQTLVRQKVAIQQVQPAASVGPQTFDCVVSGTVRLSGSLESTDTLTPGDRISISFNNCDDADGAVYDGQMRLDITSFSGDILNDQYALGASVAISDLAITEGGETTVGDGALDLDLDLTVPLVSDTTASGSRLELRAEGDAWELRDFAVQVVEDGRGPQFLTSYAGAGTLQGSGFAGAVDFATIEPLVATGTDYPATGQVLITGASGATIRATVQNAVTIQLDIDLNGDARGRRDPAAGLEHGQRGWLGSWPGSWPGSWLAVPGTSP